MLNYLCQSFTLSPSPLHLLSLHLHPITPSPYIYYPSTFTCHPSLSSRPVPGSKEASVSFQIVAANSVDPFRHLVVGFESLELEGLDGELDIPIAQ